ncbi:hypothetical protein B484DRAFT_280809, partial [Ochromonadaceae sp. CCMP2298]
SSATRETLPRSLSDAYLTGLAEVSAGEGGERAVYYSTQLAIYKYDRDTEVTTTIIAGMVEVLLQGYNLGTSRDDLLYVLVGGKSCTSIVHSKTSIRCIVVLTTPNLAYSAADTFTNSQQTSISQESTPEQLATTIVPFALEDVKLATIGGKTGGFSVTPLATVRSGSGRPVLTHIKLSVLPFAPVSLAIASLDEGGIGVVGTLYWANSAYSAHSVQRSFLDGSQVETVVTNVQEGVVSVVTAVLDQDLHIVRTIDSTYSTDITDVTDVTCNTTARFSTGLLRTLYAEAEVRNTSSSFSGKSQETQAQESGASPDSCLLVGHVLFFLDKNQATLGRMPLLPISYREVFIPTQSDSTQDTAYYSTFAGQEQDTLEGAIAPAVLLRGLTGASDLAPELSTNMYLSLREGLVMRLSMQHLIARVGVVGEIFTLNMRQLLRDKGARRQLPWWVEVVSTGSTAVRLEGICAIPLFPNSSTNAVWSQQ